MDEVVNLDPQEQMIEELQEQNGFLMQNIEKVLEQKKIQEKKNLQLQTHINELLQQVKESEKHIEKAQKDSTLNDIKIEPKIYVKGMFESFIKEKKALSILVEGKRFFYPLHEYQCKHLPISGARVLIFKGDDGSNLIYGFNISKMIDAAKALEATVKFFSLSQKRLKLHIENYGFLNFEPSEELVNNFGFKIGDTIILKQIFIDRDIHFYIAKQGNLITDRNAILQLFL